MRVSPEPRGQVVYHEGVLVPESVAWLLGGVGGDRGVYVDMTLGGGGHTRALLNALGEAGRVYSFDRDADALGQAPDDERLCCVHANYADAGYWLSYFGESTVDGFLLDLGVSLHHFSAGERGFSYQENGPLDMRMNQAGGVTLAEWLAGVSRERLAEVLRMYGEVRSAWRVAGSIVKCRAQGALVDTYALRDAVLASGVARGGEQKLLSCVFQALRIEVNDELGSLQRALLCVKERVRVGGRVVVISYHSLEDRVVKRFFRGDTLDSSSGGGERVLDRSFLYGGDEAMSFRELSRGVIVPSAEEVARNPRSRSAKMRVGERQ